MDLVERLTKMLESGSDTALLRFGLANAYFAKGDLEHAITHSAKALELDANYSAAWKLHAKALAAAQRNEDAIIAYQDGIATAERNGDLQAAKEMSVFLRRLKKPQQ